jgi:hypothetical protein
MHKDTPLTLGTDGQVTTFPNHGRKSSHEQRSHIVAKKQVMVDDSSQLDVWRSQYPQFPGVHRAYVESFCSLCFL